MKYTTILFDFDGTLADTLPVCFYSFQKIFDKYDKRTLHDQDIMKMFGPSEVGIIEQNLLNKQQVQSAIEDYYYYYDKEHRNLVSKNEEIVQLIGQLQQKNIQFGIVTGKARRSYEISVSNLFARDTFQVSITGDDVNRPKPDPEGIIKALDVLGSSVREALYVGDSNADIEAGIKANVKTVGVNWLMNSHGSTFNIKPDYEFSSIAEFIKEILVST